jgi:hypothetical protein
MEESERSLKYLARAKRAYGRCIFFAKKLGWKWMAWRFYNYGVSLDAKAQEFLTHLNHEKVVEEYSQWSPRLSDRFHRGWPMRPQSMYPHVNAEIDNRYLSQQADEEMNGKQPTFYPREMPKNGSGEPSPEFVLGHVVDMCRNGDDGVFAFNFLDQIDPQSMATLRGMNLSLDQLKLYIASGEIHPILKEQLAPLPGYGKFIAEFYQALMRPATAAA